MTRPRPSFGYGVRRTGRMIAEGWAGSWWTAWSAARRVVAVACGSPVPGLRANRGKAPLDTWTRDAPVPQLVQVRDLQRRPLGDRRPLVRRRGVLGIRHDLGDAAGTHRRLFLVVERAQAHHDLGVQQLPERARPAPTWRT